MLVWLDKHDRDQPLALGCEQHKFLLATLTTLHWFSIDLKGCLEKLWGKVNSDLWQPGMLSGLIDTSETLPLLYRPIPPQKLNCAVNLAMGKWKNGEKDHANLWALLMDAVPDSAREKDSSRNAWSRALVVAFHRTELLLYAQRQGIGMLFPDFNAPGSDGLEDFDRPWDYDHIFPFSYVRGVWHVHRLIKDLVNSIGNLRVWPMECNRSDQNIFPYLKLSKVTLMEENYKMRCDKDIRVASLIDDKNWEEWQAASPKDKNIPSQYLKDDQYKQYRYNLAGAITSRTITIYQHWFDDLNVGALFDERNAP